MGQLSTQLRLDGAFRHLQTHNIPYYILHKGAPYAGVVLLKLYEKGLGVKLFIEGRNLEGNKIWSSPIEDGWIEETKADDYIRRSYERDPDLWVIEIEMRPNFEPLDYFL